MVLNGTHSESKTFNVGVPQGSSLSPTLFIMFINDIIKSIQFSNAGLFADDIAVWSYPTSSNMQQLSQQHDKLQQSISEIVKWTKEWMMNLSIPKIQYIIFSDQNKKNFPRLI